MKFYGVISLMASFFTISSIALAGPTATDAKQIVFCKWEPVLLKALLDNGADVTLVVDSYNVQYSNMDKGLLDRVSKFYAVESFDSIEELSAVAADIQLSGKEITEVVSPSEYSQYGAGFLSAILKPKNFSLETARGCRDKRVMKAQIQKAGVRTAKFVSVPDFKSNDARNSIKTSLTFPIVIKPANGMGTMSTVKVKSPEQLDEILDGLSLNGALHSQHLIAEEFIVGEELHIDGLWAGEKAVLFSVSKYHAPRLALNEGGRNNGSIVLPEEDYRELYKKLESINRAVNRALGINQGVTHMEAFIEKDTGELVFSEIATRCGGAAVMETLHEKYVDDIRTMWAKQILGFKDLDTTEKADHKFVGWLNLAPTKSGKIVKLPSVESLYAHKGVLNVEVLVTVGEEIDLAHPSVWCILLVLGSDTLEGYEALVEEVKENFGIITE